MASYSSFLFIDWQLWAQRWSIPVPLSIECTNSSSSTHCPLAKCLLLSSHSSHWPISLFNSITFIWLTVFSVHQLFIANLCTRFLACVIVNIPFLAFFSFLLHCNQLLVTVMAPKSLYLSTSSFVRTFSIHFLRNRLVSNAPLSVIAIIPSN